MRRWAPHGASWTCSRARERQRTALSPGGTDPALLAPGSKQVYGTDTRACTLVFCQAPAAGGKPCRRTEFIAARVRRRGRTPGAVHAVAQQLPRVLRVRVLAALLVLPLVISGRRRGHQQPGQVGRARLPGFLIGVLDLRGQQGRTCLGRCGPGLIRPPDCPCNSGACRALPSAPGMPSSPRRWPATPRPSRASAWGPVVRGQAQACGRARANRRSCGRLSVPARAENGWLAGQRSTHLPRPLLTRRLCPAAFRPGSCAAAVMHSRHDWKAGSASQRGALPGCYPYLHEQARRAKAQRTFWACRLQRKGGEGVVFLSGKGPSAATLTGGKMPISSEIAAEFGQCREQALQGVQPDCQHVRMPGTCFTRLRWVCSNRGAPPGAALTPSLV